MQAHKEHKLLVGLLGLHVTESRKPLRRRENDAAITSEMSQAAQSGSRVCPVVPLASLVRTYYMVLS